MNNLTLKFNGTVFEKAVPGFYTLGVSGREHSDIDISSEERVTDGSIFHSRRIPSRTITVSYAIDTTQTDANTAVNSLNKLLYSDEPKKLIFGDESGKYWKAICAGGELDSKYQSALSGTLKFECLSPYKYASASKTATDEDITLADGTVVRGLKITNEGSVPCPVTYTVTHNGDNGYISLVNDDGDYLLFGDQSEQDTEAATKSVREIKASNGAAIVSGTTADDKSSTEFVKKGSSTSGTITINGQSVNALKIYSYGTYTTDTNTYFGAARSFTLGTASPNVTVSTHAVFATGANARKGLMALTLNNASGAAIASIFLLKPYTTDLTAYAACQIRNGSTAIDTEKVSFTASDTSESNPFNLASDNPGLLQIRKSGSKFYFNVAGTEVQMDYSGYKSTNVASVTMWICKFSGADKPIVYAGFKDLTVRRDNVEYQKDLPNRYEDGDILKIDGEHGYLRKNGSINNGDEVLGSTYFLVPPGTHNIIFGYSPWVPSDEAPTVTATYTERWA